MEVRNEENASATPAFSKQPRPAPASVDSAAVSQRLQKELMSLMMSGNLGVSAFPESENIFSWIGTIDGGKGTPYEGLSYKLSLRFPLEYPFKPPQVKFETSCFHPNVDQYGNICLDILQDMWSSAYDCRTVLLSIQSLLGEPNNDSPLNSYAATLWSNQEDYRRMVNKQYMEGVEQLERSLLPYSSDVNLNSRNRRNYYERSPDTVRRRIRTRHIIILLCTTAMYWVTWCFLIRFRTIW